jgi:hypothetical protein
VSAIHVIQMGDFFLIEELCDLAVGACPLR